MCRRIWHEVENRMIEIMEGNERLIIEKTLEGSIPFFSILKNQIENLRALTRTNNNNNYYAVQYQYVGKQEGLLTESGGNASINDTCFTILESPDFFLVN